MILGVPKEVKNNENRVAITPSGVREFIKNGHKVHIQSTAGEGSGFTDEMYIEAGANLLPDIASVYQVAEMIMKVKEPVEVEYELVHYYTPYSILQKMYAFSIKAIEKNLFK